MCFVITAACNDYTDKCIPDEDQPQLPASDPSSPLPCSPPRFLSSSASPERRGARLLRNFGLGLLQNDVLNWRKLPAWGDFSCWCSHASRRSKGTGRWSEQTTSLNRKAGEISLSAADFALQTRWTTSSRHAADSLSTVGIVSLCYTYLKHLIVSKLC